MAASSAELLFSPGSPRIAWHRGTCVEHHCFSAGTLYPQPIVDVPLIVYEVSVEALQLSSPAPYRTHWKGVALRYERTVASVAMHRAHPVWASTDQKVAGVSAIEFPR